MGGNEILECKYELNVFEIIKFRSSAFVIKMNVNKHEEIKTPRNKIFDKQHWLRCVCKICYIVP